MTRIADLQDRLLRLARRREDDGIYTDAELVRAAERALAERAGGVRFVGNIPGSSSASGFAPLTTEPGAPLPKDTTRFNRLSGVDDEQAETAAPEGRQEASDYVQGDDGFWVFWPTTNNGAYSASALRNIADKLDHDNAEWQSHLEAALRGDAS